LQTFAFSRRSLPRFEDAVKLFPEVIECYSLLGESDYLLRAVMRDIAAYEKFIREHLSQVAAIQFSNSSAEASEVKNATKLPLSLLW
jgi:Lrp/AsnC family transcriptional regulator